MKVIFVGPSNCGKTTAARAAKKNMPSNTVFLDDVSPEFRHSRALLSKENWVICAQSLRDVPPLVRDQADFVNKFSRFDREMGPVWVTIHKAADQ